ncbi:MAG: GNAT family N-acetyltransferase [Neomegalonema sp.]
MDETIGDSGAMAAPVLKTDRLPGRPFTRADWPLIHALQTDPASGPWLRGPEGPGQIPAAEARSQGIANRLAESWAADGFGPYVLRATGPREIGYAGLRRSRFHGFDEIEALWAILPAYQGKGYATEAMRKVLTQDAPGLAPSVASWTLPGNAASIRVMEKLGFVYERDALWAELRHVVYRREI